MTPMAPFIQRRNSEAVVTEPVATKMKKQLNSQTMVADAKQVTQKSLSRPSLTDSAPRYSPSDKDDDAETDICPPGDRSHSRSRNRRHRKDHKCSSTSSRSFESDESPSDSEYKTRSTGNRSRRCTGRRTKNLQCYVQ